MTFQFPLRVYFEDTDAGGVVYYANYVKYMERARSEWFIKQSLGMKKLMGIHKLVFVVSRTELNYLRSAKLEDLLNVSVELVELKKVSAVFRQVVSRSGETLCEGLTRVACVNTENMRPSPIPVDIFTQLQLLIQLP
jgi:acyl-CoA thioester hydrolase